MLGARELRKWPSPVPGGTPLGPVLQSLATGCGEGLQCHPHASPSTTCLHTVITSSFCHQCSTVWTPWPVSVFHFQALIVAFGCSIAFFSSWIVVTLLTHLCYKTDLPPSIYPRHLMFPGFHSPCPCSPGVQNAWFPFCDSGLDLQSRRGICSMLSPDKKPSDRLREWNTYFFNWKQLLYSL